jgi:lipoprotein-anchoring transpeptidase ErfK/SrfK
MGVKMTRARAGIAALVFATGVLLAGCSPSGSRLADGFRSAPPVALPTTVAAGTGSSAPAVAAVTTPRAKPVSTPCTANPRARWVFVSLRRQHLWMCARHRVVKDTAITSGMTGQYTETPSGDYRIQGRSRNTSLTLNTGATYAVKYWIPFDAPLFGFHDSSWQDFPYGSAKYKTAGSHGCVHMPLAAIRFLYDWADIGTPVRIRA